MGCPYMSGSRAPSGPVSNEYPFQKLYRPWSWGFSSFGNVFILLMLIWITIRLMKNIRKKVTVVYRRVVVKKSEDDAEHKMKAIVIGGLGFVGRGVVKHLVRDGTYQVHVLDRRLPDEDCREEGVRSYVRCNLMNVEDVEMGIREAGADVVFHTASMDPTADVKYLVSVSEEGTEKVLLASQRAGVKRLIYTSSVAAVIGDRFRNYENIDETLPYPDKPCTRYAAGMAAAEELLLASDKQDGLLICALRAGAIYGIDPMFFKSTYGHSAKKGDSNLDAISVDYFSKAHIVADKKLSTNDISGKAYFISGESITCSDFCSFNAGKSISGLAVWSKWLLNCVNNFVYGRSNILLGETLLELPNYTINGSLAMKELSLEKPSPWKKSMEEYTIEYHKTVNK
ncbi:uncharacterized protein [Dysidea avara]|uniref:uncharacterized protein n=1 Tax=Dysidea avara TaxID=196820 RepID=UPI00332E9DEB